MPEPRRTTARTPELRRFSGVASLLLALVFALKLCVALQLDRHPLLQPDTGLDTSAYTALAKRVAAGDLALGPGLYYLSPLYIYFLAPLYAVSGSFTTARVVQALLGTGAIALIFLSAQSWFGRRAAWISATIAALSGVFTYYEALLLQSALDPFLTALALWLLTRAWQRDERRTFFIAGIAFGIATLNRPNMMLAAGAVALLFLALRKPAPAALLLIGTFVGIAPVTIRNVVMAHQFALVSSHGGINVWIGNGEGATGYFHDVPGMRSTVDGLALDGHRVAEQNTGRPMTDAEVSSHYTRRALDWMRAHPLQSMRVIAAKVYGLFNTTHASTPFSYTFYAFDTKTPLRVLLLGPWLFVPLGILALLRARNPLLSTFALAYGISVALFFITERYKLPLYIALVIASGGAVEYLFERKMRTRAIALIGALLLFCNWPLHLDDGRGEERTRMAEYYAARGDVAAADEWTKLALERGTRPADVHVRVAAQLLNASRAEAAVPHLEIAASLIPDDARVHYLFGRALLASGRARDAVAQIRRAVELRVDAPLASYDLAAALIESGDRSGAAAVLRTATIPEDVGAEVWLQYGKRAASIGAPDIAERYLRRASQLAPRSVEANALLAGALMEQQRYADAIGPLDTALQMQPENADLTAMRALAEAELGRDREAWRDARRALELRPKHPIASRALQLLYARGVTAASMP